MNGLNLKTGEGTIVPYDVTTPPDVLWQPTTLPVSGEWRGIAYGNGKFVAVHLTTTTTPQAATSPTG